MNNFVKNIETKLRDALAISHLDIVDESHLHAGHAGARPGGNSHYNLTIIAAEFEAMPKVKRHQTIYRILKEELDSHIHALAITARSPSE